MFPINDLLDAILLGCFLFGLIFTVLTLLLGFADVGLHGDHGDAGESGHDFFGHDIVNGLLNVSSILAFVTWFGGIGYLVRVGAGVFAPIAVVIGVAGGLVAALGVSWFMVKVLRPAGQELNPADYEMAGVIARVTSSIRAGGFGEIVYEMGGTRHVGTAQADTGEPIGRGTEVIVLRVERGVAIVDTVARLMDNE
ncbi:MAG: NfeD family protein [Thermomicrobiales bacterium]